MKLVSVSWKKICRPLSQGRLNLKSLINLNQATNLKLCWNLVNSQKSWAVLLRDRVLRNKQPIKHHIFSSLWSGIKDEYLVIQSNSIWLLEDGKDISFWNDSWCGPPLSDLFNVPESTRSLLKSSMNEYISNNHWHLPTQLIVMYPSIVHQIQQVHIPTFAQKDQQIWKHTSSGVLMQRDAYDFKQHQFIELHWASCIWSKGIPPAKSLFVWRFMHNKVPTDENLMIRGCNIPSMCSLCLKSSENSFHLFFECQFATTLWNWLANTIRMPFFFSSKEDIWKLCDRAWSPQCKVVIRDALINLISIIWYVRNQARFITRSSPRKQPFQ